MKKSNFIPMHKLLRATVLGLIILIFFCGTSKTQETRRTVLGAAKDPRGVRQHWDFRFCLDNPEAPSKIRAVSA